MENENDAIIMQALKEAGEMHNTYLGSEHLLLAILRNPTFTITRLLNAYGMNYQKVRKDLITLNSCYGLSVGCDGASPIVNEIIKECEDSSSMVMVMLQSKECLANCILEQYHIPMENLMH